MEPEVKIVLGDPCLPACGTNPQGGTDRWRSGLGLVWGIGSSCTHAELAVRTRLGESQSHTAGSRLFSSLRLPRQLWSCIECVLILIKTAAGINNAPLLELPQGLQAQVSQASSPPG